MTDEIKPRTDSFRNFLAFALIGTFVSTIPLLIFFGMPDSSKETVTYIIGQVSGMATTCLAFYFTQKVGQDALDMKRTDNTSKALDAIAAVSGSTMVMPGIAGKAADAVAEAAVDKADEINGK